MPTHKKHPQQSGEHYLVLVQRLRSGITPSRVCTAATFLLAISCGEEPTTPSETGPISLSIVSGDGQAGINGTELPNPLIVKVTNSKGLINDLTVNFRVTAGGGSMFAGSASTDPKGFAADYWTLGTTAGEEQTVEVRAVLPNGQKQVFAVFHATALPTPNTWTTKAAMPTARWAMGVSVLDGLLYAVGGSSTATSTFRTVEAYDPTTDSWATKASMPTPRRFLGTDVIDGTLYAVGGASGGSSNKLEAYNPGTDTWSTKAPMPTPREQLGVAALNGILYAVGGFGAGNFSTVEAYNPATDTWVTKAPLPTSRNAMGVAVLNGILYVVGGVEAGAKTARLDAYDPNTDTWTTKAPMPTARMGLAVAVIDGLLYAIGGTETGVTGSPVLGTVEAYNPTTNTWTTKASMPTARAYPGAGVIEKILYAVGGLSAGDLATVEAYQP